MSSTPTQRQLCTATPISSLSSVFTFHFGYICIYIYIYIHIYHLSIYTHIYRHIHWRRNTVLKYICMEIYVIFWCSQQSHTIKLFFFMYIYHIYIYIYIPYIKLVRVGFKHTTSCLPCTGSNHWAIWPNDEMCLMVCRIKWPRSSSHR